MKKAAMKSVVGIAGAAGSAGHAAWFVELAPSPWARLLRLLVLGFGLALLGAPAIPEVLSMAESGYADINMDTWLILAAPKGTPEPIKVKLKTALAAAIKDPEFRVKLKEHGFEPAFSNASAASEQIKRELPLMRAVAHRSNITLD